MFEIITYNALHKRFDDQLLGNKWHNRRKLLTPAFHFSILQQFVKVFADETEKFLIKIEDQCQNPFIDVLPLITMFTLGSICGKYK